ncbi:RNA polymerase sigma factor [Singulisphaera sp. PoT]|uniref:RNA polymerase sigma factor n=1 Tax=Singulisphaera sp. PoT TaxID=3411797 RepID=UPI003BF54DF9
MTSGPSQIASRSLTVLFESGTVVGLGDHELVARFAARNDEHDQAAEAAFAALVTRHGPMVFSVCRATLGDRHEAEDAFQATFLVLAGRAGSIRSRRSVGPWLHGVALRVASRARANASRRRLHERRRTEMAANEGVGAGAGIDGDVARAIHEEVGRLPERFRKAVVLCYLEGRTHEMAAEELGCPVGTIRSRLAAARERLKGAPNAEGHRLGRAAGMARRVVGQARGLVVNGPACGPGRRRHLGGHADRTRTRGAGRDGLGRRPRLDGRKPHSHAHKTLHAPGDDGPRGRRRDGRRRPRLIPRRPGPRAREK